MNKKFNFISVLFVDDHTDTSQHAKDILNLVFGKVFIAHDGCEAIDIIKVYHPNIIISDFKMPCLNGIEVIDFARKQVQRSICILITAYPDIDNLLISINDIKVDAYFVKPINFEKIISKISSILDINTYTHSTTPTHLSPQEQNIFLDTVRGLKPRDIAKKRDLKVKTVSTYKYRILNKLSLKNDTELTHYAIKQKLI